MDGYSIDVARVEEVCGWVSKAAQDVRCEATTTAAAGSTSLVTFQAVAAADASAVNARNTLGNVLAGVERRMRASLRGTVEVDEHVAGQLWRAV